MPETRAELKRRYHRLQMMADSTERQQRRNDLMRSVARFLSSVGQAEKFDALIDASLREGCSYAEHFTADDAADCFHLLETVAANLFLQPWRLNEFAQIKIWSTLFRSLSDCLGSVDRLFELIGYERNRDELLLLSPNVAAVDRLVDVAFDFFAAQIECRLLETLHRGVCPGAGEDVSLPWSAVYRQRAENIGDVSVGVEALRSRYQSLHVASHMPVVSSSPAAAHPVVFGLSVSPQTNTAVLNPNNNPLLNEQTVASSPTASASSSGVAAPRIVYPSLDLRNYSPTPSSSSPHAQHSSNYVSLVKSNTAQGGDELFYDGGDLPQFGLPPSPSRSAVPPPLASSTTTRRREEEAASRRRDVVGSSQSETDFYAVKNFANLTLNHEHLVRRFESPVVCETDVRRSNLIDLSTADAPSLTGGGTIDESIRRTMHQLDAIQSKVTTARQQIVHTLKRRVDCPRCQMTNLAQDTIVCPYCQFLIDASSSVAAPPPIGLQQNHALK